MILLLAGTTEARLLSEEFKARAIPAMASFAGVTAHPLKLAVPTRSGGFGGEKGLREFLGREGITAIVDATHPFAAQMTARAAAAAAELGLPYLKLMRPGWDAAPTDRWRWVDGPHDLPAMIPEGRRVFLATGRQHLQDYAGLQGRRLIVRVIDATTEPFPFADGQWVVGRPPFDEAHEAAFLKDHRIDWIVAKDSGAAAARAKLDAARALAIPVAMIRRPALPAGAARADSVAEAVGWVLRL